MANAGEKMETGLCLLSDDVIVNLFFDSPYVSPESNGILLIRCEDSNKAKAYYPSGVTVVGIFSNGEPLGKCDISFIEQNVNCQVEVKNGKRHGSANYKYDNGLVVHCEVNETSSTLWLPPVPYCRNYYNQTALGIGGNTFQIESVQWKNQQLDEARKKALYWLLENFDVAQLHIRIDLTGKLQKNLPKGIEYWASNKDFSRLQQATLCAHKFIIQNMMNYSLPSIPKLSNLNVFLSNGYLSRLSESYSSTDEKIYMDSLSVIYPILKSSPYLNLIHIIAFPRSALIFGELTLNGKSVFKLSELKHLTDVIVESKT